MAESSYIRIRLLGLVVQPEHKDAKSRESRALADMRVVEGEEGTKRKKRAEPRRTETTTISCGFEKAPSSGFDCMALNPLHPLTEKPEMIVFASPFRSLVPCVSVPCRPITPPPYEYCKSFREPRTCSQGFVVRIGPRLDNH